MKKASFFYLLTTVAFLSFAFASCKSENVKDVIQDGQVHMRIKNVSQNDFKDMLVAFNGDHDYGDIAAGEYTDYKSYDALYRYAYLSFNIEGEQYVYQPYDFVGEILLKPGYYTYELSVNHPDHTSLEINLVED